MERTRWNRRNGWTASPSPSSMASIMTRGLNGRKRGRERRVERHVSHYFARASSMARRGPSRMGGGVGHPVDPRSHTADTVIGCSKIIGRPGARPLEWACDRLRSPRNLFSCPQYPDGIQTLPDQLPSQQSLSITAPARNLQKLNANSRKIKIPREIEGRRGGSFLSSLFFDSTRNF